MCARLGDFVPDLAPDFAPDFLVQRIRDGAKW